MNTMSKTCKPVVIVTDGGFRNGLCDCFDDFGLLCKTWCLPCLTVSSTQEKLPAGTEL